MAVGGGILVAGSALVLDVTKPWNIQLMQLESEFETARKEVIRGPRLLVALRLDTLLEGVNATWKVGQ